MGLNKRRLFGILIATLVATAMPGQALTVLLQEDWEDDTVGSDYCIVNPGTTWTCTGTLGATEVRGVLTNLGTKYLAIGADQLDGNSAPRMYHTFNEPTGTYEAMTKYEAVDVGGNNDGNFLLYRLTDVNGNNILELSFRDADRYLEVTNNSAADKWEETNFEFPSAWRNVTVKVYAGGTYDLRIWDGNTLEFQKLAVPYLDTSNGKATKLTIGSTLTTETASGFWDDIKVQDL